ncbi:MAG: hypothetical protein U0S12_02730 [Fimbriimonadales bacterium]
MLGSCAKIVITKENTTIVNGKGEKSKIEGRLKQIKAQIEVTDSSYDKEKLQERQAKLSGGVAVVKVGAATETALEGEEGAHRGRPCGDPRGAGRGHRSRRRYRALQHGTKAACLAYKLGRR